MPSVSTGQLVAEAYRAGAAVVAFNVVTLEHAEAIVAAAEAVGQPAILQVSQNAVRYHAGALGPIAAAIAELVASSPARLAMHLDHVEDMDLLRAAPAAGFSSAMYDAAALPYAENVEATRQAVVWAHSVGLWLEAELGYVGGKPGAAVSAHAPGTRTDPAEARVYVADTKVDALAVAVGSTHAMTAQTSQLDHDLIARLRQAVPVPLVLHGASGVANDQLQAAVRVGITKINVGTSLNVAFVRALGATLNELGPGASDPRPMLAAGRAAIRTAASEILTAVTSARGPVAA